MYKAETMTTMAEVEDLWYIETCPVHLLRSDPSAVVK